MMIHEKGHGYQNFLEESVTIYDMSVGEFYPCDTIEFEESDDVLDKGSVFLEIKT